MEPVSPAIGGNVWSRLTIGQRFTIIFAVTVVVVLAISLSSVYGIGRLGSEFEHATSVTTRQLSLAREVDSGLRDLTDEAKRTQMAYVIHDLERGKKEEEKTCSGCHAISSRADSQQKFEAAAAVVRGQVQELRRLATATEDQQVVAKIDDGIGKWITLYSDYLTKAEGSSFDDAHAVIMDQMLPLLADLEKTANTLKDRCKKDLATAQQSGRESVASQRWIALVLLGVSLLVVALAVLAVRSITRLLRALAVDLSGSASEVADAAGQVHESSETMAANTTRQVQAIEKTRASSDQIRALSTQNSQTLRGAAEYVIQSQNHFQHANKALQELISSMAKIDAASSEISKILKVIDEIAFQTNILALNAAVEAARAGEAGLGFAVVADEVRSLAQRCAQASKDTGELIENSLEAAKDGKTRVDQVSAVIRDITDESGQVQQLVQSADRGERDQVAAIEAIAQAVEETERVSQHTSTVVENGAVTSRQLATQAAVMRDSIGHLHRLVGGGVADGSNTNPN